MKAMEKPILFNTEMIKSILEGRKTVTRRIIKQQPKTIIPDHIKRTPLAFWIDNSKWIKPPYQVGDVLWVKETFEEIEEQLPESYETESYILPAVRDFHFTGKHIRYIPNIHMPKSAARIFLKVTDVRVERLQNITEDEAFEEAVTKELRNALGYSAAVSEETFNITQCKDTFKLLWNSTVNKKDLDMYGWNANPFVWVVEFERVKR